ncbi:MAG: glycosyltransferase family 2 protein [Actinomycetota bacterium]|nr:glycosyltransferase family 2 protein [Actinomycetota bacterium]
MIVNSTGGRELLRACLASLERHAAGGGQRVWVVDNASTDGAPAMVREEFPDVRLVELDANYGFCVANNVALRQVEAPYVLVLNPDTEVAPGVLDHMVAVMEERPDVGMAGCRLVMRDGTFDHAAKRSFPTPLGALAHFLRIGRSDRAPDWLKQYRAPELGEHDQGPVDSLNGAFMLVRREALRDVGLLDERYWLYMDDLDWCFRFHRRGWGVWYDGRVTVLHVKGGTTVTERRGARHRAVPQTIAFHRSMGRFYRKFYAGRNPALDVAVYLAIGAKTAIALGRSVAARRSLT